VKGRALNRWLNVAWLLVAWVMIQVGFGYVMGQQGMLLATPAHIGGFIAGVAMQRPLLLWRYRKA
jgi:membrane associated rhomboid family serine protease